MFQVKNFPDMKNAKVIEELGAFQVVEYERYLSVSQHDSQQKYFQSEMNVRRRQVICNVSKSNITLQGGAMQWMIGNVNATTGLKGVGDFIGKVARSKVTGETAIMPEYTGSGLLVTEPTYLHKLLIDVADWKGAIALADGLFLACESSLQLKTIMRDNLSSAFGGKGLFNLSVQGKGVLCLESPVTREEIVEIDLQDDVLKVDGSYVIAWSNSLDFTVERSGKTLLGSAASGEGLVNVYRGTGRVWLASLLGV